MLGCVLVGSWFARGFSQCLLHLSFTSSFALFQREGLSPHSCPSPNSRCCYLLLHAGLPGDGGGGECSLLFWICLNLSQVLCDPVQPPDTGLGSRCLPVSLPMSPYPRNRGGFCSCCCFIIFHQCPKCTRLFCPSSRSFREIEQKDPGGCCSLLQAYPGRGLSQNLTPPFLILLWAPVQPWKQTCV